ncbi:regulator of replication initiation timing [Desulfitispora alkaliphila]|uniref:initiation-control protein YabA n=1 Tax=Desulfitispora alkaliphila TaxID=622674 RepID=UPI003D216DF6
MKVTEALIEVESKIEQLLEEVQTLKMHVYALEEENQTLKAQICSYGPEKKKEVKENVKKIQGEGYDNLVQLYEQGFHICHLHFGQARDEDCLFCMGFLKRE